MAANEALRHEPAVGRPQHVRRPHTFGIQYTRQPVEELRRGRHVVRIVRCDNPVVILEGRNARKTGLSNHRPAR